MNPFKKTAFWKIDILLSLVVIVGFEIIDQSVEKLQGVLIYGDFLSTAKWLLVAGFTLHGVVNWWTNRN